jgi:hypothetical protein
MTTKIGWTKPFAVARLHADPSGVQEASTTFQALLFPGMSTQTARLRYISLFAAAKYYRMKAGATAEAQLPLSDYMRRLEALIAVSSVRHHIIDNAEPDGIVGRGAGRKMSQLQEFELKTELQNPPYNIYRGTLYNLGIFDTSKISQPLYDQAKSLAQAWDIDAAGIIGKEMIQGILPESIRRETVDRIAPTFCICNIPRWSAEQQELMRFLFAQQKKLQLPNSHSDEEALKSHSQACRSLAWRFLLKLVLDSDNKRLGNHHSLIYLLTHDFVLSAEHPALHLYLQTWRWIAARTFFERGWTQIFTKVIHVLHQERNGLSRNELQQQLQEDYLTKHRDEPIDSLMQEVKTNYHSSEWLLARFEGKQYRDFLLCICVGLFVASEDKKSHTTPILEQLWKRNPIPFSREYKRYVEGVRKNIMANMLWVEIAEESLVQHFQIALRKMSSGNPDSLLVDFDSGQWRAPEKALDVIPGIANGFTRLDIGLEWAEQLGLIEQTDADYFTLTEIGLQSCIDWDEEHAQ